MRKLMPSLAGTCLLAVAVALSIGAMAGSAPRAPRGAVVATTTHVTDLVRAVAGDRVRVAGLLAANAEPHDHELTPSDAEALDGALLVVRSGGDVDAWADADVDLLAAAGGEDPHWWQDPRAALRAIEAIRRALAKADPENAAAYAAAARAYVERVRALDTAIARCWARVPPDRRRIVTTHDSYGRYADRYDVTVVGTVLPALSARAQPSARALARLVRAIRRERVRAVFTERALPARTDRAVAREAGARVGRPLTGDALPAGTSYLDALAADTRALVDGVTGGAVHCELSA